MPTDYAVVLLNRIPIRSDDPATADERADYKKQGVAFTAKLADTQAFLTKNELSFPTSLRARVLQLRVAMMLPVDNLHDARAILDKAEGLSSLAEAIRTEIARSLRVLR